jgi:hypothetical protein
VIIPPSTDALRALHVAVSQPWWPEVAKFLEVELAATLNRLVGTTSDVELRQLQGRAKFISDFQAITANTADMLKKQGF